MKTSSDLDPSEPSPAPPSVDAPRDRPTPRRRIDSIDLLRGIVMVIMMLEREAFGGPLRKA